MFEYRQRCLGVSYSSKLFHGVKIVNEMKIVQKVKVAKKEVENSDSTWRFVCGDVL